ncbi:hypothetical protein C8J57DRAFT_1720281 [Mycena rebaudengoi]|nr:hypothetical protein C8J57DRAFT_1720281 [Mycena rebaudengoi]
MPSRTSSHPASDQSASGSKWHATVPVPDPIQESEASWDDTENAEPDEPLNLDDPWAYTFEPNDRVWIRNNDKWIQGRIFSRSSTKVLFRDNIPYWNVFYQDTYGHKLRKYFAPLRGEIKPDTSAVRALLRDARWIQ